MPARLSLTKAQRDALLTLPDTEEAFIRHYSFTGEDGEILWRYRTPETRLAFALQLCILRYPGRVLRRGEVMPLHLLAFIAKQVGVPPAAIGGFARRPQTRYEHLAALRRGRRPLRAATRRREIRRPGDRGSDRGFAASAARAIMSAVQPW